MPRKKRPKLLGSVRIRVLLLLAILPGCKLVDADKLASKSPLESLAKTPNRVELELNFVRLSPTDQETIAELWTAVDELSVSADQRRQLGRNGFRVGTIGNQLPEPVVKLLREARDFDEHGATVTGQPGDQFGAERRQMLLMPRQHGEIVTSSVQPDLHVLTVHDEEIGGQSYMDGQTQFSVMANKLDDGRVRIRLTPEVHHGPFRQRYVPGEGMFRLDTSRKKKIFQPLEIEATLAVGQILVLGSQAQIAGSLGHRFFHESTSDKETHKLLLVRIAESTFQSSSNDGSK